MQRTKLFVKFLSRVKKVVDGVTGLCACEKLVLACARKIHKLFGRKAGFRRSGNTRSSSKETTKSKTTVM